MAELGITTSRLSLVRMRVDLHPISITSPQVSSFSIRIRSPILKGRSIRSTIPVIISAIVDWAASPMIIPLRPRAVSDAVSTVPVIPKCLRSITIARKLKTSRNMYCTERTTRWSISSRSRRGTLDKYQFEVIDIRRIIM